jgi:hypothetical protein
VERRTHVRRAEARAHEAPGADPAVWLLLAVILVALALALGTGLSLLLPAAL